MVRPVVPEDYRIIEFYNSIDPGEDFAYKRPPVCERVDTKSGPANKIRMSGSPLAFKLVEKYVDLGLAIERGNWRKAYEIYRYLKLMLCE